MIKKKCELCFVMSARLLTKCWHEGLFYRLSNTGIRGQPLQWFQNYLSKRQQRVLVRGQSSDWGTIKAGVRKDQCLDLFYFSYM